MDAALLDAGLEAPDSGPQACKPNEVKTCYAGPMSTAGVGICQVGLAACVGDRFGPCEGEILPEVERCDGIDESCALGPDDGCPSGAVELVEPYETATTGWSYLDAWGAEGCGASQVIVGLVGRSGLYLDQIGEHCATPSILEDTTTTPYTYSLVLTPGTDAPPRGGTGGEPYDARCPAGEIVVGLSGRSGDLVDQISFSCAHFEVVDLAGSSDPPRFAIREVLGSRTLVPLQAGGTGGEPFDLPCPTDRAAARLRGATCCGGVVATLGVSCRELWVTAR